PGRLGQVAEAARGRAEPDLVGDDGPFVRRGHAHRATRGPERQPAPRVELPGLEPERRGAVEDLVGDQVNAQPLAAEAAPSADRISDRLDDGSAETNRSVSPCSRV